MLAIFIISPLIAFLLCLRNLDNKTNAAIFILFYGLYGFCQHFQLETADIHRIGLSFQNFDISKDAIAMYQEGEKADLYLMLVFSLLRPITANPKVFGGFIGLIFGFLCCKYYQQLYRNWVYVKRGLFFILVLLVLSDISLVTFTGVRYAPAAMLFLNSVYRYIYSGNKAWIVGVMCAPLIHFALWACVIVFALYLLLPMFASKWSTLFKVVLIAAFCVSFIDLSGHIHFMAEDSMDEAYNAAINRKAMAYTGGGGGGKGNLLYGDVSLYRQANSMFFTVFKYIRRVGILVMMWMLVKYADSHAMTRVDRKMYMLLFVFAVSVMIFESISYDLGWRSTRIWWELMIVYFARLCSLDRKIPVRGWLFFMLFVNFVDVADLFFNVSRLVEYGFWWRPMPFSILNGVGFQI